MPTAVPRHRRAAGQAVAGLVALVVGGGSWLQGSADSGQLPAAVPVAAPAVEYPVQVRGDVVIAGDPRAPVTLDVYEDFHCEVCGDFQEEFGPRLEQAAASGAATVRFHPVVTSHRAAAPPGYSTVAAAAALCAADAGVFPVVRASLFEAQPREGGPVWTRTQLKQLGREVGAGEGFVRCLRGAGPERVADGTWLAQQEVGGLQGRLTTPSVLVNGEVADIGDPDWLGDALRRR